MSIFNDFPYSNFHGENLDWILSVVKRCNETLNELNNMIASEVATQLKPQMEEFKEYYTTLLKDFEDELKKRADAFEQGVTDELSCYQSQVDDVKSSFEQLKESTEQAIKKYQSDFTELKERFDKLEENNNTFVQVTTASVNALEQSTSDFITESDNRLSEMEDSIKDFTSKAAKDIEDGFTDMTGLITSTSVAIGEHINATTTSLNQHIDDTQDYLEQFITSAAFAVRDKVQREHQETRGVIDTTSVAIGELIKQHDKDAKDKFQEVMDKIDRGDTSAVESLKELTKEITGYKTDTEALITSTSVAIGAGIDDINKNIGTLHDDVAKCGAVIATVTTTIINELRNDLNEINTIVSTASTAITQAIRDEVSDIVLGDITISNVEVEGKIEEARQSIESKLDNLDTSKLETLITTTSVAIGSAIDECCSGMHDVTGQILSQVQQNETQIVAVNGSVSGLGGKIDELKKSVSDSKTKLAAAITEKGIKTAADAAFAEMTSNIKNIPGRTNIPIYFDVIVLRDDSARGARVKIPTGINVPSTTETFKLTSVIVHSDTANNTVYVNIGASLNVQTNPPTSNSYSIGHIYTAPVYINVGLQGSDTYSSGSVQIQGILNPTE